MADIVNLNIVTRLDIPAERVIKSAADADLENAVVLGWEQDGSFYFASSYADGAQVLWMLEQAKRRLFEMAEEMTND